MQIYSQLHKIEHPLFDKHKLSVQVKRDDLIDKIISGNKWRKLKYNLQHAKAINAKGVITFGGCFSNHIHASAFACHQQGLNAIGIIRGELENQDNYTLAWAKHWGMQLQFVDRKTYRQRNEQAYLADIQQQYPNYLIIPEGGSNSLALPGMGEVIAELNQQATFDTLLTPVGSGGTIAGLIAADNNEHNILGIAVLKQASYLQNEIRNLLPSYANKFTNWQLNTEMHRGGYAKFSQEDATIIREFSQVVGIDFEPIYSGKMILALLDLINKGYFAENHKIVLLHTGGLQGLAGMFSRGKLEKTLWPELPLPPTEN